MEFVEFLTTVLNLILALAALYSKKKLSVVESASIRVADFRI